MCFMFGADRDHVRRVLGLLDEARHDEVSGVEETPVSVPAAGDRPRA
ncbi:hypothetical protein SAMN05216188_10973 [Lentzea xinjiangensis]|uniref:Uncharacterized protein n=1 Tax=Lentzea xinjiangensis TaxID=402600 RepID=A0A1H9MJH8_9PSEU|nr:hypothetical protein [Lentzea xinjiangensis]SER23313.1 hypothetical protein SAMN05216188_10973 [Lentzea xinjiangensis]